MASNRGRKRASTEFPSGQAAKKMAEYCTVSEGPEKGVTYNTDINRSGVPLKELANPMTIVYPIKVQDFGSPLYRRILYTWGLPNALRSGLRKYRHWTEEDIESHLSFLHAPLKKKDHLKSWRWVQLGQKVHGRTDQEFRGNYSVKGSAISAATHAGYP